MRPRPWVLGLAVGAVTMGGGACAGGTTSRPTIERVVIPAGASFAAITDTLVAHGIVTHPTWFELLGRMRGIDRSVQAGVYEFPKPSSSSHVLSTLAEGRVVLIRFTVPEGLTTQDVAELAAAVLEIPPDSFAVAVGDTALLRALALEGDSFEGFLFPETYTVPAGAPARQVVRLMAENFLRSWQPEWDQRLDTLGMTRRELVTLASILEEEIVQPGEGPLVAAVYHNRLRRGMRLQADPTVQYAIQLETGHRKNRLLLRDYQFPSRFNTYLHAGLPPGPISSPGIRSIEASLNPA